MKYRRLGTSGLKVSEVGLGCSIFGARLDQAAADAVIGEAISVGVNFFDTADYYAGKKSEVVVGAALKGRRQDVVLATKFGLPVGEGPLERGGSRRHIMNAVEASLKRLETDYIDLYQIHWPDAETPIEETLRALDDLVRQGKVRYLGNSNFTGWMIADADWIARDQGLNRFVSTQSYYNPLRPAAKNEVLPACERFGVGLLPFFPLAAGLLTGRYKRDQAVAPDSHLAAWGNFPNQRVTSEDFDRVEGLEAYAKARGHTLLELAFGWHLAHAPIASVIAGASSPDQVRGNAEAAKWELTPDEMAEVNQILSLA